MIDLSILAAPLALLATAAPPPPDPVDPPPPFRPTPPTRVAAERAAVRWEEWYWNAPGAGAETSRVAATCGPTRPAAKTFRCFVTYLATAPDETPVQVIDWFRNCRVVRHAGNGLVDAPPASGAPPIAYLGLGGGRAAACTFTGYAVEAL